MIYTDVQKYYNAKFQGLPLSELKVIENKSFLETLVKKAQGRNLLKCTDFDGCESHFVPNPLKALPSISKEQYLADIKTFRQFGHYHFINTSRNLQDFDKIFEFDTSEHLNIFGCKGNQFRGTLENTKASQAFIKKFKNPNNKYDVITSDTYPSGKRVPNGSIFVKIEPKPISVKQREVLIHDYKQSLAPLRFSIEDKGLMITHHWRGILESEGVNIDLSSNEYGQNIIRNIIRWKEKNRQTEDSQIIRIIYKEHSVEISKSKLIDYGIEEYNRLCQKHFNDQINNKELRLHEDRSTYILELIDVKVDNHNKGSALTDMIEAFGGNERVMPWTQGDSVGKGKDDEPLMIVATDNNGVGCAVLRRDPNEILGESSKSKETLESRKKIQTSASHLFNSCSDTTSFMSFLVNQLK